MITENSKEHLLIKRFIRDLEALDEIDEEKIAQIQDDEYRDILQLAKKLTKIDFGRKSKATEELKIIMSTIEKNKEQYKQSGQLADEELDYVAGGLRMDQENSFRDNDRIKD